MSNDIHAVRQWHNLQELCNKYGLTVKLGGDALGFEFHDAKTGEFVINKHTIERSMAYLEGRRDGMKAVSSEDDYIEAIEKLKTAGHELIRAINGPIPRPSIDDSIDRLEELL